MATLYRNPCSGPDQHRSVPIRKTAAPIPFAASRSWSTVGVIPSGARNLSVRSLPAGPESSISRRVGLGMRAIGCEPAFSLISGRWLAVRGGSIAVEVLQGSHLEYMLVQRADAASRREGGRERGDAGDVVADGGAADRFLIVERLTAQRRIDDDVHLTGFD